MEALAAKLNGEVKGQSENVEEKRRLATELEEIERERLDLQNHGSCLHCFPCVIRGDGEGAPIHMHAYDQIRDC